MGPFCIPPCGPSWQIIYKVYKICRAAKRNLPQRVNIVEFKQLGGILIFRANRPTFTESKIIIHQALKGALSLNLCVAKVFPIKGGYRWGEEKPGFFLIGGSNQCSGRRGAGVSNSVLLRARRRSRGSEKGIGPAILV